MSSDNFVDTSDLFNYECATIILLPFCIADEDEIIHRN